MRLLSPAIFALTLFFFNAVFAQTPGTKWVHTFGNDNDDRAYAAAKDGSGNIYITGSFTSPIDFDPGPGDFTITPSFEEQGFLLKLDPDGNFLWAKTFGGGGFAVTVDDSGNVITTGWFTENQDFDPGPGTDLINPKGHTDIFIEKLDSNGNYLWSVGIGGTEYDYGNAIATNANGDIFIGGSITGNVHINSESSPVDLTTTGGSQDIFVAGFDSSGELLGAFTIGGSINDEASGITVDLNGHIWVTGNYRGSNVDFNPDAGTALLSSPGSGHDIFVLELDPAGDYVWAETFGSPNTDAGRAITTDESGDVYVTGNFSLTVDFDPGTSTFNLTSGGYDNIFVLKLDNSHNFAWAAHLNSSSLYSTGEAIAVDGDNNVYVTGNGDNDESGGSVYTAKLNSNGTLDWEHLMDKDPMGSGGVGKAILEDGNGNIFLAGYFSDTMDFGFDCSIEKTSEGGRDFFVEKLGPGGMLSITDISPAAGSPGTAVTITGSGFTTDPNAIDVTFTGNSASVNSSTITTIETEVPAFATTGPITVTIGCASVTSSSSFAVYDLLISPQPGSSLVCEGDVASFATGATGTTNITYQWQKFVASSYVDLTDGGGYTGTTTSSLDVNTSGLFGGGKYRCRISGDFVPDTYSRVVILNVNPLPCTPPPSAPSLEWASNFGSNDVASAGQAIAVDHVGNVYVTGIFESTTDFDPGPDVFNLTAVGFTDVFLSKFDATGNFLWAKSFGGDDTEYSYGITLDNNENVMLTGTFYQTTDLDPGSALLEFDSNGDADLFIVKLDSDGNLIWAKTAGGGGLDEAQSITSDTDNNVLVTGHFGDVVDFDPGPGTFPISSSGGSIYDYDIFVLKLDDSGDFAWAVGMGNSGIDHGRGVVTDELNNVYVTGQFDGSTDMDPGPGDFTLSAAGGYYGIYVLKLDADGNFVWAISAGGDGDQNYGFGITVDQSSNIYLTGAFTGQGDFDPGPGNVVLTSNGNTDAFVMKVDSDGNFIWANNMGGTDFEESYAICVDAYGNVFTTGYFYDTIDADPGAGTTNIISAGDYDIFISKLDAGGNFLWADRFGGSTYDFPYGITADHLGNIFLTGLFQEAVDFNPDLSCALTLDQQTNGGVFVQKLVAPLTPCPDIISEPGNQSFCEGSNATLNVVATGINLKYQWQMLNTSSSLYENISNNSVFSGATTATLTIATTSNAGAGTYRCIVRASNADPITSSTALVDLIPAPSAPGTTNDSKCSAGTFTLNASGGTNGSYRWYTVGSGGSPISGEVNNSYTTPSLSTTTSYFVSLANAGCESARSEVIAQILSASTAPVTTSNSICGPGTVGLGASGASNGQYRWYTTLTGGSPIAGAVNDAFTTPSLGATTSYFVSINNGSCESGRAEAIATITPLPSAPTTTAAARCGPGSLSLSASGGTPGQYRWYTTNSGGTSIAGETNNTFTTPALLATTQYFVSIDNGCEGARSSATATINALPAKPTITSNLLILSGVISVCQIDAMLIAPTGFAGYTWSDGSTSQQITATFDTYTVSVTDANGCTSVMSDPVQVLGLLNCVNSPPVISDVDVATSIASTVSISIFPLLSDEDDNLNLSTLQITSQPESGAIATLDQNGVLSIDYSGISFSGTDHLTIQVCDNAGACTDHILSIDVAGDIKVYNAFSPNGDALNNFFFIQYIDALEETRSNKVSIFNRWGDEVFSISDYNNSSRVFAGVNNNGNELPSGTYFYKIEFAGKRKPMTGYVTLRR